jgi:hypothetical protein
MLPALPMLRTLPTLQSDKADVALPMLITDSALRRLILLPTLRSERVL